MGLRVIVLTAMEIEMDRKRTWTFGAIYSERNLPGWLSNRDL